MCLRQLLPQLAVVPMMPDNDHRARCVVQVATPRGGIEELVAAERLWVKGFGFTAVC